MPAPPPLSEPAIVKAIGARLPAFALVVMLKVIRAVRLRGGSTLGKPVTRGLFAHRSVIAQPAEIRIAAADEGKMRAVAVAAVARGPQCVRVRPAMRLHMSVGEGDGSRVV